jgi:hypothetical protein
MDMSWAVILDPSVRKYRLVQARIGRSKGGRRSLRAHSARGDVGEHVRIVRGGTLGSTYAGEGVEGLWALWETRRRVRQNAKFRAWRNRFVRKEKKSNSAKLVHRTQHVALAAAAEVLRVASPVQKISKNNRYSDSDTGEGRAWRGEAGDSHGRQADELV